MYNRRKFYKSLCFIIAFALVILVSSHPVIAEVYTEQSDFGDADTVYVAGNPDAYPLEYYSEEKKAFCGVFPDMLKAVSEKTGISFTYISASDKNLQKELSRNNQVEIVTALLSEQNECSVAEILPVLEISSGGEKKVYSIGFTKIASPELTKKIKNAFSLISEDEKMGYLLTNASNNPEVNEKDRLIKTILFSLIAFLIIICGIIAFIAVKRK